MDGDNMREKLQAARRSMGYTQKQMAKMLGYKSKSQYSMIENGQRGVSVEHAIKIASILQKPVEELFNAAAVHNLLTTSSAGLQRAATGQASNPSSNQGKRPAAMAPAEPGQRLRTSPAEAFASLKGGHQEPAGATAGPERKPDRLENNHVEWQKIRLADFLDLTVLQQVIDHLAKSLGLAYLITDATGDPVTGISNPSRFCNLINLNTEGQRRCTITRVRNTLSVLGTSQHKHCSCHTGLVHIAVPITVHGLPVGALLGGNIAIAPPQKEDVRRLAGELGLDPDELWTAAAEVPVWSREQLNETIRLFSSVSNIISQLFYDRYQLQQIIAMNRRIASSLDIETISRQTVNAVAEILRTRYCILRLLDEERQELVIRAAQGLPEDICTMATAVPVADTVIERLLQGGEPLAVPDIRENHEFRRFIYLDEDTRAALVVPLTVHGRTIGTLAAYLSKPHIFTQWEIEIVSTIARQAARAVENAWLDENLRGYYLTTIRAIAAAVDAKDIYTRGQFPTECNCSGAPSSRKFRRRRLSRRAQRGRDLPGCPDYPRSRRL